MKNEPQSGSRWYSQSGEGKRGETSGKVWSSQSSSVTQARLCTLFKNNCYVYIIISLHHFYSV